MKQYLDKDQTAKLIELGFPKPQGWGNKDISNGMSIALYNDGREDFNYSIGELIEFLESNTDINIWYDGKSHYWSIDYGLRRIGIDNNLVDALYFACKTL